LSVRYASAAELVSDHDQQFVRGGLLVRGDTPAGLSLYDTVEVELFTAEGSWLAKGQVVQLMAGVGVAVAFQVSEVPGLAAAVERARQAPVTTATAPASGRPAVVSAGAKLASASNTEKIQIALHGSRDERMLILRDLNRTLHPYVLKNPNLQLDEVVGIAKMTTVGPELLKSIADRRDWAQKPEVAVALVKNPKTPVGIAVKLLDHVSPAELRQIVKHSSVAEPIVKAARKKVLG
jgi:hypothetical protein